MSARGETNLAKALQTDYTAILVEFQETGREARIACVRILAFGEWTISRHLEEVVRVVFTDDDVVFLADLVNLALSRCSDEPRFALRPDLAISDVFDALCSIAYPSDWLYLSLYVLDS